jgi:plastocyanin domain-containing protein
MGGRNLVLIGAAALVCLPACRDKSSSPKENPALTEGAPAASSAATVPAVTIPPGAQRAAIKVTKEGFEPVEVKLTAGKPAVLEFTRETESECLNAVRMPWLAEPVPLPMHQTVVIPIETVPARTLRYSCWMNMVFGKVTIAPPS